MTETADFLSHLQACPHCDLLLRRQPPGQGQRACCPRCGCTLASSKSNSLPNTIALCLAGMFIYLPAMLLPLLTMEKLGLSEVGNVLQTVLGLYRHDYYFVALAVLLSAVVFPALLLLLLLTVSLQIQLGRVNRLTPLLFRAFLAFEEWAMVEVYLFGILVTIFKMSGSVDIIYNSGFFSFIALVFTTLGLAAVCDHHLFWEKIAGQQDGHHHSPSVGPLLVFAGSAARSGLTRCRICGHLQLASEGNCAICAARLHQRQPNSISITWALVVTSALLLLPANLLPIMEVEFLGVPSSSTIMDGILYFFEEGSYLIGLIIFTASVLVPLFKIVGLLILLLAVHKGKNSLLRKKTIMFRVVTFIGRWSMLDIFVIAILNMLVQFGLLSSIQAAPAATYFCVVVATTMLAAISFDPRIMWDRCLPSPPIRPGSPL